MARKMNSIPSYFRHSSGQARVRVDGRDILLGPYDSKESRIRYAEIVGPGGQRAGCGDTHSEEKTAGAG